jgi:penicillin-binding protein-related factor A (putative recombinase)
MIAMDCIQKHLTGSDFEDLVKERCDKLQERRLASISKYGVKVRFDAEVNAYRPIRSLPDFEGVFGRHATQVIFDCKVVSGASFPLSEYRIDQRKPKALQLRHMYDRSSFGAVCFFLVHFNGRELKKSTIEAQTYAMPVHEDHAFWRRFEQREEKSISPRQCEEYGVLVPWTQFPNERTLRPDLMVAIEGLVGGVTNTPRAIRIPRSQDEE